MILIEGKVGKSRVLEDLINNRLQNRNVAIIDTVGVKGLSVPKGVDHFMYDRYSSESAIDIYNTGWFKDYDWVVFEVNADITKIDLTHFKEIDRNSTQNFIITVQNDSIDNVRMVFA
jgi:hypothetical protein